MSTLLSAHRKPFLVLIVPLGVGFTSFMYFHSNVRMDFYLAIYLSFYNLEIKKICFKNFMTAENLEN